jgi:hypothetical protein
MTGRLTLVALLAAAAHASPAAAQSRCTAPDQPGSWHSCLAATHRTADERVHLSSVRPRLVIRYEDGCPDGRNRRPVVVRTADGERLGRTTLRSRCKRGVARWDVTLKLDVEVPTGTVVRSFWSGIPDAARAPKVEL